VNAGVGGDGIVFNALASPKERIERFQRGEIELEAGGVETLGATRGEK